MFVCLFCCLLVWWFGGLCVCVSVHVRVCACLNKKGWHVDLEFRAPQGTELAVSATALRLSAGVRHQRDDASPCSLDPHAISLVSLAVLM